jgi:signal transduction histidine kinase/ActR/RegA family two-component response regulator
VSAAGLLVTLALVLADAVDRTTLAVLLAAVGAAGVLVCVVKTVTTPGERALWLTLGTGKLGWSIAAPAYLVNSNAVSDFPTVGDSALLFYPAMLGGFVLLARRRLVGLPRPLWLDAALGGLALAAVGAFLVYEPLLHGTMPNDVEAVALVYTLADLVLAGFIGVAIMFAGWRTAPVLLVLGLGAALAAVADGAWTVEIDHGHLTAHPLVALGWTAGVVMVALAAPVDDGRPERVSEPGWALAAVPVIAALAAVSVLIAETANHHSIAAYLAEATLLLAVLRLAISLIDNQRAAARRRREDEARRAREEAERANRAKTEFLSRMSHEVRTPLNSILGFAQLLVDDVEGPERASVERILRAGNHLRQLIDDILDLSAIEAGQTAMSLEPTPLEPTIAESTALLEPLARRTGTGVVRRDADDAPSAVVADPQRLKQVLLNLISNAMKYGGSESDVVVCVERNGPCGVVKVIDAGPGIPEEHMEDLFTPFERGAAQGSGIEGSGLGLALTKNLVETMDGSIDVETGPNGTTFSVSLPAADRERVEVVANEEADERRTPVEGRRTVLYIEDNVSNIALVERLLARRPGFELLTASAGRPGLRLARTVRPDVVLLDLDLPDIPGEEVLAELRADPATADIPVIVVSADATSWRQEEFARAGAAAYVVKPIQLASFMATLDRVLSSSVGASS